MTTFLNQTHPYLRIYNPDTGEYAQFTGGKLELDDDDANYAVVKQAAINNPSITILETAKGGKNCPECGELFTGTTAAARLSLHRKAAHFDSWLADKQAADNAETNEILKAGAGIACDICQPAQVFPDAAALARHTRLLHEAPDEDAAAAVTERRPGEVAPEG
jgi:uncharacterized protein (UPF0212 family)